MSCVRCERPACSDCLREASVGYQCVDCVRDGARTMRTAKTIAGAPVGSKPLVVPLLIVLNVLVFAITVYESGSFNYNYSERSLLFVYGQEWPPIVADGQWWRLFTAGFLHYGPLHLVLNMASLWFVGRDLELVFGRLRFVVLYALSLFGGGLAVFLFEQEEMTPAGLQYSSTVGASGAIFGLLGALLVVVFRLKLNIQSIVVVIALNIFISVAIPQISLLGHLGGLVVGAVVALGMVFGPANKRALIQVATCAAMLALLVLLFLVRDAQFGLTFCRDNQVQCAYVHQR